MIAKLTISAMIAAASLLPLAAAADAAGPASPYKHVLVLSIDGMHPVDLDRFVESHPASSLARLESSGVIYPRAFTSSPSDSFPGTISMFTGGSPKTTGVYYDVTYDRALAAPGTDGSKLGTVVAYDETIDFDSSKRDAGGGIDPSKLPVDSHGKPVWPHAFLQVNTVFEVAHAAGLRTAYSDKHPAYEMLSGPSGAGIDDFYGPEIEAGATTKSAGAVQAYDDDKVAAIIHEIDGMDHTGVNAAAVPAIFGMNFQALSVAQKDTWGGYLAADGTPSPAIDSALTHIDYSIGTMLAELEGQDLLNSTLIVVTAKHGQAPIDSARRRIVDKGLIESTVNGVAPGLLAEATLDDVGLIWLTDQSKTAAVVAAFKANAASLGIDRVLSGKALADRLGDPMLSSRAPDIALIASPGVIYASKTATKLSEHGGFSDDDTHVALLVSSPSFNEKTVKTQVNLTQIAPTILVALGLDPNALQAVKIEHTPILPGLGLGQ